eukprot:4665407-Alexandrium_andersonii.AAC.1
MAARHTVAHIPCRGRSHRPAPARPPPALGEQPSDTHAAVHGGALPIGHGCLLRTSNFHKGCAHAA